MNIQTNFRAGVPVEPAIENALSKLPKYWKEALPNNMTIEVVLKTQNLPHIPDVWTKDVLGRSWSIRTIIKGFKKPPVIVVYIDYIKDELDTYVFMRDILATFVSIAMKQAHIRNTLETAMIHTMEVPRKINWELAELIASFFLNPNETLLKHNDMKNLFNCVEDYLSAVVYA